MILAVRDALESTANHCQPRVVRSLEPRFLMYLSCLFVRAGADWLMSVSVKHVHRMHFINESMELFITFLVFSIVLGMDFFLHV